jgi:hypothetical protein
MTKTQTIQNLAQRIADELPDMFREINGTSTIIPMAGIRNNLG